MLSICLVWAAASGCAAPEQPSPTRRIALGGDSALRERFLDLEEQTGVPAELLAAISYSQTRLQPVPDEVGEIGAPRPLDIEATAWELSDEGSDLETGDLPGWVAALRRWGGRALADDVTLHLSRGFRGRDADGRLLVVSARDVGATLGDGLGRTQQSLGYSGAIWNPASSTNYTNASRGAADINYVVIHTVQGSYGGAISWFQNPSADVSAHYVVRSSDGEVTHMVDDADVAWHDACFNSHSIGIEHEGYVGDPGAWYTEAMYMESAKLTAWLADAYGIPADRDHIMGHGEAPDCSSHSDPGPGWNWTHYMDLVHSAGQPVFDATYSNHSFPEQMESGEEAVVWFEFQNGSNITWGLDETRLGTAEPQDRESPFYVDGNWLNPGRATGPDHSTYNPGSVGRFTFMIRAPEVDEPTTFTESYRLVQEGVEWFGPVVSATVTVVPAGWDGGKGQPNEGDGTDGAGEPGAGSGPLAGDGAGAGDGNLIGGCAAGGTGAGSGGCAILLFGAILLCRRRRARRRVR